MIPKKYIAIAFLAGAVSAGLASFGELGFSGTLIPANKQVVTLSDLILVALIAPIVEECVKPIGLYLIGHEEKPNLTVAEWAWLGFFAGLGFALIEDALYAVGLAKYGAGPMLVLLGMRLALPLHMIATTLTGIGIGLYQKTKDPGYFAAMLLLAMTVHGVFNFVVTVVG